MGKSLVLALEGIDELRKALRDLPEDLAREARGIVEDSAYDTARDLLAVYPGRGPLRNHVFVVDRSEKLRERWVVESRSAEASWWEFGTENRATQRGWSRGSAPAHEGQGLLSISKPHRRSMIARLYEVVRAAGFQLREGA